MDVGTGVKGVRVGVGVLVGRGVGEGVLLGGSRGVGVSKISGG